jgi:hypothetical protein
MEHSLPFNILFIIALSSILSPCPNHLILCHLINLTISSPFNNVFSSSLSTHYFPSLVRIFWLMYIWNWANGYYALYTNENAMKHG